MKPEHVELIVKAMGLNESSAERLKNMSNTKDEIMFKPDQLSQLIAAIEAEKDKRIAELEQANRRYLERCALIGNDLTATREREELLQQENERLQDELAEMQLNTFGSIK